MKTKTFDIIIAGAGLSGLSLAWYLATGGYKGNVLVIDQSFAPHNNKTWCYWSKEKPFYPEITYKKWRKSFFSADTFDTFLYMQDFMYYCIRESDFKEFVLRELKKHSNFTLLEEAILDISGSKKKGILVTKNSDTFVGNQIFQSIIQPESAKLSSLKYPLVQHFLGLEIKSKPGTFDPETFIIMDVDNNFDDGFAFMYVLPYSLDTALIEFTVFSKDVLKKKKYREKITTYISEKYGLQENEYEILREEYGEIPMDDRKFVPSLHSHVYNIGTIAGFSKPSTGYTFTRVQKFSQKLAQSLIQARPIVIESPSKNRYRYYDILLLHILSTSTIESRNVFKHLFKNNSIDQIFNFLNEDGSILDDLRIMNSVPYTPFFKAIANNLH